MICSKGIEMKLIQILAIAAALAVTAPAQNANSANQNSGSTAQPKTSDAQKKTAAAKDTKTAPGTPIKVTVPKDTKKGAATAQKPAGSKPSASTSGNSQAA